MFEIQTGLRRKFACSLGDSIEVTKISYYNILWNSLSNKIFITTNAAWKHLLTEALRFVACVE